MKFTTIAALVGVASAIEVEQTDDNLMQQSAEMEQLCQNMGEIDEESLVETEVEADESEDRKKISGTSKQHYNRSTKQINAENNHILSTQSKCLNFVRKYRGHPKVCYWYRFQGHKWVRYGKTVNIKPTVPRGAKICRPFYMLKKFGFPSSLGAKSLPRCRVGSGKKAVYYMWKNRSGCRFLGGRLVYQKHAVCKAGKPHQWARVVRCVRGAVLSKKGLNYKTGQRHSLVHICAKEGGKCKCTGTMIYGHGKTWAQALKKKNVIKKVKGVTSCTNKALGKDPLPGVGKVCMCK